MMTNLECHTNAAAGHCSFPITIAVHLQLYRPRLPQSNLWNLPLVLQDPKRKSMGKSNGRPMQEEEEEGGKKRGRSFNHAEPLRVPEKHMHGSAKYPLKSELPTKTHEKKEDSTSKQRKRL